MEGCMQHNDGGRRPRHLIDCSLQLSTFLPLTASTFFHLYSTEHHFSAISDIRTHSFIFSFPLPSSSSVMQSKCRHVPAQPNFLQRLPHLLFCWTRLQSGSFKLRQQLFLSLFTNMSAHFGYFHSSQHHYCVTFSTNAPWCKNPSKKIFPITITAIIMIT